MNIKRILILAIAILIIIYAINNPAVSNGIKEASRITVLTIKKFWYNKEINVIGLDIIDKKQILSVLPEHKSVIWWLRRSDKVEKRIAKNPYVGSVRVEPCSKFIIFKWGCFNIKIEENRPSILSILMEKLWIVGDDGSFIEPIRNREHFQQIFPENEGKSPVIVLGLYEKSLSPDVVKARAVYVRKAISMIELESSLKVSEIELQQNAEMLVTFKDLAYKARFGFYSGDFEKLILESQRLKKIVSEIGGKSRSIAEIDLAYKDMAVVKPLEEVKEAKAITTKNKSTAKKKK